MSQTKADLLLEELLESPEALAFVRGHLEAFSDELVSQVLLEVDDSPFGADQWILSLGVLEQWLGSRSLQAKLNDQIGYVSCAASTVTSSFAETSLPEVVEQMLSDYGFDRAY